jgi:hypothetical protein
LLDRFGFSAFFALAAIGCLYLVSKKAPGNGQGFGLVLGGGILIAIGFFGPVLDALIIPLRWQFMSQVVMAIPAALGVLIIASAAGRYKQLLLGVLVGLVSFSMVADVAANFDTRVFSSTRLVRAALTRSELTSMDTIAGLWPGAMAADLHAITYLHHQWGIHPDDVAEDLDWKYFEHREGGAVLIRDYITKEPFYVGTPWKLDYEPRDVLREQGFGRLYDSGSVELFFK